ncbi:MAG: cation-translocating P-type ATPase, partial [Oxalobacter sp.]|nr:cation-translocating P-type ATPase [Oxalobacter sp.]
MKHEHIGKTAHDHEHDHGHSHDHDHDHAHEDTRPPPSSCGGCGCSVAALEPLAPVPAAPAGGDAEVWKIPNMDCPVEEKEIRQALDGIEGIHSLFFHLSSRSLTINATGQAKEKARQAIEKAGYKPKSVRQAGGEGGHDHVHTPDTGYWKLGVALVIALSIEILHFFAPDTMPFKVLGFSLAVSAILLAGTSVYTNGIRALLHGRLNISALMAVAVTGACILGQWAEAAMVMVLYAIAELIEARSVDRARNAIHQLLSLTPESAELRLPDGHWEVASVKDIRPGQIIRVKPGERIPLDGMVVAGHSAVNQMAITGESIPVARTGGDMVYAGSINESGILELDVTALASDTMLSRIIRTVEEAQEARAPVQRFVDRFAAIYTPAVFIIALAIAVIMPLLTDWTWWDAIYRALVLLVIACPCALVIATPLTVVSGLAAAARAGILIKGGVYLEEARKLKAVAFDKTGTITEGKPRLVAVENIATDITRDEIRQWTTTMTSHSTHPVSKAIYDDMKTYARPGKVENFTEMPGKGSMGTIDGTKLRLGSVRWIEESTPVTQALAERLNAHEKSGYTVTLLASDEEVLALFAVADTIRVNSWVTIEELACRKITPVMLTGDNTLTAETIAGQAGIKEVHSNLLPDDKLNAIASLQTKFSHVAMVGDGINDAPALATANIGIA